MDASGATLTDNAHREPLTRATAAWLDLLALSHAYQAAILRGDVSEAENIRVRAHDVLDANLDHNGEAASAVRSIIRG